MSAIVYPAGGWLPPGAHLELKWDDQGRDFATNWRGRVQAPGNGVCIRVLSDRPFPNGFGPRYPVVRIDTGVFRGHEFYLGHTTTLVSQGEHFPFGHGLAVADQGKDWAGTHGGWVELGEAFGGSPGPKTGRKWFDGLLERPLVVNQWDSFLPLHGGIRGKQHTSVGPSVLLLTHRLAICGWIQHRTVKYDDGVIIAVKRFQSHHHLQVDGITGPFTWNQAKASAEWCRAHHKTEI